MDLETTGWEPEEATITEIGAVLVCGGRVRAQFSSLVNPGGAIPEQVATLTGISDAMVASAPPLSTVLTGFLSFARGSVLAAHNAPFDVAFLTAACKACDLPWPEFQVLDTVELAHRVLGEEEWPTASWPRSPFTSTRASSPATGRCRTPWLPRTCSPRCCAGSPSPVSARWPKQGVYKQWGQCPGTPG